MSMNVSKILIGFVLNFVTIAPFSWAETPTTAINPSPAEGYHDVTWGTALDSFKTSKNSSTAHGVKKTEAVALAYLLMNFHEPAKDSNYHSTKNDVEKIAGDTTDYLFYSGHFVLAVNPINLKDFSEIEKSVSSKYEKKNLRTYTTEWIYSATTGTVMMEFDYQEYKKSEQTNVYLIKASSYNQDQSIEDQQQTGGVVTSTAGVKTDVAAYLVYVSNNYFTGTDNAWADYQAYAAATPVATATIALSPTPTLSVKQLDLKKVE